MKLRYFLATLLFTGLFCYASIVLITAMVDKSLAPLPPRPVAQAVVASEAATDGVHELHELHEKDKEIQVPVQVAEEQSVQEPVQEIVQESVQEIIDTPLTEIDKPFIPQKPTQWGEATRGIVHRVNLSPSENSKTVFLTINAYSANQEALIQELVKHNIKATFFLSGYYVRRNTEVVKQLASNQLFDIQNLGNRSRSLSVEGKTVYEVAGTNDVNDALKEVSDGAESIAAVTGKKPKFFRSATGYTDDVAVAAVTAAGTKVIGYQYVTDGGGTIPVEEIKNRILQAENGSIIVVSINPERPNILKGLQAALEEISAQKLPLRFEKLIAYESSFETIR